MAIVKHADSIDSVYGLEITEIGKLSHFMRGYEHMRKVRLVQAKLGDLFNDQVHAMSKAELDEKFSEAIFVSTRIQGYNSKLLNDQLGKSITLQNL